VVGIGINVNQAVFISNPPNPTSFLLEKGSACELETLIAQLMQFVESRYLQLKSGKIAALHEGYLAALYRIGTAAKFRRAGGEIFYGTITGTMESGRLRVLVQEEEATFDLKEISFVL
jgi:BirA family biotin operon repressor/biotin-[acetyl-CoA-carboxylase] ligase